MNLHKMIEIYLKYDNMHIIVMINALICINNYIITCINNMLSRSPKCHIVDATLSPSRQLCDQDGIVCSWYMMILT